MNRTIIRPLAMAALVFAGGSWAAAQETSPESRRTPSDTTQDAKDKATWAKKAKDRAKADAAARANPVDLNHASKTDLKKLKGMTDAYADAIIANRPYKTKADVVTKGALPLETYQAIHGKLAVR